jgi:hypothetical protein
MSFWGQRNNFFPYEQAFSNMDMFITFKKSPNFVV